MNRAADSCILVSSKLVQKVVIRVTVLFTLISIAAFGQEENIFLTRKVNKGIYYSYRQFRANIPDETENFECKPLEELLFYVPNTVLLTGILPNQTGSDTTRLMYMLHDSEKKKKKIKNAYAFSDGRNVYINSALYQNHSDYYLKVLDLGRIVYTRDPIMEKMSRSGTGAMVGIFVGGIIVGGLGATIGHSSSHLDSRGVIIFAEDDGVPYILNKKTITSILANHDPELYKQYQQEAEPESEGVLEKYVLLFNQRNP